MEGEYDKRVEASSYGYDPKATLMHAERARREAAYGTARNASLNSRLTGADDVAESSPTEEASEALRLTNLLHEQIDALEGKIFAEYGAPKVDGVIAPREPLFPTLRGARQRLDTATERLAKLIQRIG